MWATLCAVAFLAVASVAFAAESKRTTVLVSPGAEHAEFAGMSTSGDRVFFYAEGDLVPADTDGESDIYEWRDGAIEVVSNGPLAGNGPASPNLAGVSTDGSRVLFGTEEQLLAEDTDERNDIYLWDEGTFSLLSQGPGGGNGEFDANPAGNSPDLGRVVFYTAEQLVAADEDSEFDFYERSNGVTRLISTGPVDGAGSNGGTATFPVGEDAVIFRSASKLVVEDEDTRSDVYERAGETTTLLSVGPTGGNGPYNVQLAGIAADGSRAFFATPEAMVAEDTDASFDVYERAGGSTALISTGPADAGEAMVFPEEVSVDGTRVLFQTDGAMVPADVDGGEVDLYERAGGVTTLVSTGPADAHGAGGEVEFRAISADGTRVVFDTAAALVAADADGARDVYERSAGTTRLLSEGSTNARSEGISADGETVIYRTGASLLPSDADGGYSDLYAVSGAGLAHVSIGSAGGSAELWPDLYAVSDDGRAIAIQSVEALDPADTDEERDVYLSLAPDLPAAPGDPGQSPPAGPPAGLAATPRCAGAAATIVGSAKRDVLRGSAKRDVIFAGAGNDKVIGRGGNDLVCAGAGKDTVLGGAGNDRILGQGGADSLFGGPGRDTILGGGGPDLCRGQGGEQGPVRKCER